MCHKFVKIIKDNFGLSLDGYYVQVNFKNKTINRFLEGNFLNPFKTEAVII